MNVILLEKIGKLGEIGDTASVSGLRSQFPLPEGQGDSGDQGKPGGI